MTGGGKIKTPAGDYDYKTQAVSVRLGFFGQNPAESGRVCSYGSNSDNSRITPKIAMEAIATFSHFAVAVLKANQKNENTRQVNPNLIIFPPPSRCPAFFRASKPACRFF